MINKIKKQIKKVQKKKQLRAWMEWKQTKILDIEYIGK